MGVLIVGSNGAQRLQTVIAAWYGASGLSRNTFRERLLDPYTSDKSVDRLRSAARGVVEARTHEELGAAGANLPPRSRRSVSNGGQIPLADANRRAIVAASNGTVPNVVKASAAGADAATAGAVLLGGIMLYLALKSLEQGSKPGTLKTTPPAPTTPSPPLIVEATYQFPHRRRARHPPTC